MTTFGHGSYVLNNVNLMDLIQIAVTGQQIAHGKRKKGGKMMQLMIHKV